MSLMGNPWWAFVTLLVLAAATCDHFIPMRYRLSAEGVELRGPGGVRQYRWNVFTSAEASGDRVALYSRSRRKLTLRCEDNCEAVLEYIQQHTTN